MQIFGFDFISFDDVLIDLYVDVDVLVRLRGKDGLLFKISGESATLGLKRL
jgi:hypothetical protein